MLHLVVNMVSLLIIGCHVERVHGCLRTGLVYITTGIVGSIGDFRTLISIRRRLQYSCRFVGGRGERHPHEPGRARSASHIMVQGRPPCGYSVMDLKRRCSSGRHRHITQLRIRSMHVQLLVGFVMFFKALGCLNIESRWGHAGSHRRLAVWGATLRTESSLESELGADRAQALEVATTQGGHVSTEELVATLGWPTE